MPAPDVESFSGVEVLYLDDHLLAIDKPAGLLAQKDRTGDPDAARLGKAFLEKKFDRSGDVFLGVVHRIDRPVSGVMVLARSSKAARGLSRQFRERLVEKRYLAVVEGTCEGRETCIDYIVKANRAVRITGPGSEQARRAEMTYQAVAQKSGLSLLQVRPTTGRPHQIRLQLSERGFPIWGDRRYGAQRAPSGPSLGRHHIALHSYYLGFEHPIRHGHLTLTAMPPDWDDPFRDEIATLLRAS